MDEMGERWGCILVERLCQETVWIVGLYDRQFLVATNVMGVGEMILVGFCVDGY
jgi:hypothetical protein